MKIGSSASAPTGQFRLANPTDCFRIMELYHRIYQGGYRDPLLNNRNNLQAFLEQKNHFWFVVEQNSNLVASVVLRYDPENRLAKAFGAVVAPEARGGGLMEHLLAYAIATVRSKTTGIDVVYATTRTVHEAAQALTEKLGFKKLGIFPNSHKTEEFETHCLTALFLENSLEHRFKDYSAHESLKGLLKLVHAEVPNINPFKTVLPDPSSRTLVEPPVLELIESPHFVQHRFKQLKSGGALQFAFFPFHEPNILVTSPDQSVEIFCYHSRQDGYSVILGGKVGPDVSYTSLFNSIAELLRGREARYIELLIRADKPKIFDSVLKAKFIPSAFFPAFQLHDGKRYDYVVFSKTFEIFDFKNIRLKGTNQLYLEEYVRQWMKSSLPEFEHSANYPHEASHHPYLQFSVAHLDSSREASAQHPVPSH